MRVLLLGGAGFIGSHLATALSLRGEHAVSVLEPTSASIDRIQHLPIHLYRGSLSDTELLESILVQEDIQAVIHLVSTLVPGCGFTDFEKEFEQVVAPSIRLMELCSKHHVKLVYFSSGGTVYGERATLAHFTEKDALTPISHYGWSKQMMEESIRYMHRTQGLQYLILRPSNAYGPGQNLHGRQGLIAVALGKALRKEAVSVWGDGIAVRDYIYIDDLVQATLSLLGKEAAFDKTFNVGSGVGYSVNDILRILKEVSGLEVSINYLPARQEDVSHVVLAIDRIREMIDFQPIGIQEGIRRFASFVMDGNA
ncbi:MAG: NAD-dependent epimerase/dehydratase family protein [Bacteroidales bacterium]|nr:NAD-dependent epimerase/dehydratase family protein [Bacteroidales bacterium]